jgi:beta-glucosidase
MRRILLSTIILFSLTTSNSATPQADTDARVEALLKMMTLEEKVGQMTQVTLDVVTANKSKKKGNPHELDEGKLREALVKYHVGSVLNIVTDEFPSSEAFTVDHWHKVIGQIQKVATEKTRLKIPVLYGIDAIHGANYTKGATLFPQAAAMAASRNLDLVRQGAKITAQEVRLSGIPWNFNPVLDVGRQPLWPRLFETYGEDTYLATKMGVAYIQGHEGVATCLKHYIGYSYPFSGKDRTPTQISERELRDKFLPTFAAGVRAGSPTVMINSGSIDGIPGHANPRLLKTILRDELGFKGFTVSDWEDIERLHKRDRVAATPKEAVKLAVMSGVDMSMVPYNFKFATMLVELVKDGEVPMSRIDEAVRRILKVKVDLGLFENPIPKVGSSVRLASAESTAANLTAAQESITLLKNDKSTLPLAKSTRVLVAGPTSNLLSAMNGGWTITWQGQREELYPQEKQTALEAIQEEIGADKVVYAATMEEALNAINSKKVDVALLFLGEKTYTETPGNIDDLNLDPAQIELAAAVEKTGIPTVITLFEGRPRVIRSIVDQAAAIVMAYLPGMEGGRAVADVLFGDVNPSGRLPFTYPRAPNALTLFDHIPMESKNDNKYNPEWPFGHGLSYTTFRYSSLRVSQKTIGPKESVKVSVTVKNTGRVFGKEAVDLYVTDMYGSVSRPVRTLGGFKKVALKPGESQTVEFELGFDELSFVNADLKRVVEPGEFVVSVGQLQEKFFVK